MSERLDTSIKTLSTLEGEWLPPIVGSFLIGERPTIQKFAPAQVENACVGLELPVRWPHLFQYDCMSVEQDDLIASLLIQGHEELADWFEKPNGQQRNRRPSNWAFNVSAGKVAIDSIVSTESYYRYLSAKYS